MDQLEQQAAYATLRAGFAMPHWSIDDLRKAEEQAWRATMGPRDRSELVEVRLRAIRDELKARGERV